MPRYAGSAKGTVEGCRSIDVLDWNRRGFFKWPHRFSWSWSRQSERVASINVATEHRAAILTYRSRSYGQDWSDVEQRIPVVWSPCRFGGERPWFLCSVTSGGVYCGRRVTKLYGAGRLFACRHCYRLAYASQQESVHLRGLCKAQKIRMQLGGSASMLDPFPEKPKGMHWGTYDRLHIAHDAAAKRSTIGIMGRLSSLHERAGSIDKECAPGRRAA
jgi:hypothetical protein